jgi:hypothetical protein
MASAHFVYLYRTLKGDPVYVGYGRTVQRALSHSGASHNSGLQTWLERNQFDLHVAGPYANEHEARAVEAALISSLNPRFNRSPGDGPKFVPIGVPPELWERPRLPELSLRQIGIQSGGALLVYLAPGDSLRDGRKKFEAALPTDKDAVSNIEKYWDLKALIDYWDRYPSSIPRLIIGIHGRVNHRFIVGALKIDRERICDPQNQRSVARSPRPRWQVPLSSPLHLDECELRGRRVKDIRFGQFSHQLHIWVDSQGKRRH